MKNETQNKTKHLSKYRPQSTAIPLKWIPYPSVRNLRKSKHEKIRHSTFFSPKNKPLEYFVLSLYHGRTFNSFFKWIPDRFPLRKKRVKVAFGYLIFAILLEWQFWGTIIFASRDLPVEPIAFRYISFLMTRVVTVWLVNHFN